jgi:large subunit ribosomal protein L21
MTLTIETLARCGRPRIAARLAVRGRPGPRFYAMSYAIISLGGKQYRVSEGERLLVDRLPTAEGKTFHPDVLMVGGDGAFELAPKGVQVTAKVVGSPLGKKIRIGKYRPKTGYRRHTGFRAKLTPIGGAKRPAAKKREEVPAKPSEARARPAQAEGKLPRGYADFTIADIGQRVGSWSAEQLDAALEYERAHANRKGALATLESARKEKES